MEVSLAAEKLFQIGSLPVTNSMLLSWIVGAVLVLFAFLATRTLSLVPSDFQNFAESIVEALYNLMESIAGERAKLFFPLLATFFLFIILNNWAGLLPGVGSIGLKASTPHGITENQQLAESQDNFTSPPVFAPTEAATAKSLLPEEDHGEASPTDSDNPQLKAPSTTGVLTDSGRKNESGDAEASGYGGLTPLLRAATSDLNTTLALALISVAATQYFGISRLGLKGFASHYFHSPLTGAAFVVAVGFIIGVFIGLLEVIAEFVKIISLSFRLFGNVYAGEAVLHTVSGIAAYFAPIPFLLLEVIVGFVQAAVFMMLTLVFMSIITEGHGEHATDQH